MGYFVKFMAIGNVVGLDFDVAEPFEESIGVKHTHIADFDTLNEAVEGVVAQVNKFCRTLKEFVLDTEDPSKGTFVPIAFDRIVWKKMIKILVLMNNISAGNFAEDVVAKVCEDYKNEYGEEELIDVFQNHISSLSDEKLAFLWTTDKFQGLIEIITHGEDDVIDLFETAAYLF